jgi:hypothetical protein
MATWKIALGRANSNRAKQAALLDALRSVAGLDRGGNVRPRRLPHLNVEPQLRFEDGFRVLPEAFDADCVIAALLDGEPHALQEANKVVEKMRM